MNRSLKGSMNKPAAYKHTASLDNTRSYLSSLLTISVTGDTTGGLFAMVDYKAKRGNEPPPHYHQCEHEFYYILDGQLRFYCGEQTLDAQTGDYVFIPQGAPHTFDIISILAQAIIMVTSVDGRPVGLDRYFIEMSEPATVMGLPTNAVTHRLADPTRTVNIAKQHCTIILSPQDAAAMLPAYPGFGLLRGKRAKA